MDLFICLFISVRDGLTRSGTGCFKLFGCIHNGNCGYKRVKHWRARPYSYCIRIINLHQFVGAFSSNIIVFEKLAHRMSDRWHTMFVYGVLRTSTTSVRVALVVWVHVPLNGDHCVGLMCSHAVVCSSCPWYDFRRWWLIDLLKNASAQDTTCSPSILDSIPVNRLVCLPG